MKLSAIVITKNEEKTIQRCLTSLKFADEIIVIDAASTDQTTTIARQTGARVITNSWPGYGLQKNLGRDHSQGDWLLFIDADEEISPSLASEITRAINQSTSDFYWLRVLDIFLGSPLNHLTGHNLRLFKKSAGRWTNQPVHEQVETLTGQRLKLTPNSPILINPLIHHSHATIKSYLNKMRRYTSLDAQQMGATGHHRSGRPVSPSFLLPYKLAARQFIKLLIYKKGLLDGYSGFIWSLLSAYYEYEMAQKYLKLCA